MQSCHQRHSLLLLLPSSLIGLLSVDLLLPTRSRRALCEWISHGTSMFDDVDVAMHDAQQCEWNGANKNKREQRTIGSSSSFFYFLFGEERLT